MVFWVSSRECRTQQHDQRLAQEHDQNLICELARMHEGSKNKEMQTNNSAQAMRNGQQYALAELLPNCHLNSIIILSIK